MPEVYAWSIYLVASATVRALVATTAPDSALVLSSAQDKA
jgi:hypothetical protein